MKGENLACGHIMNILCPGMSKTQIAMVILFRCLGGVVLILGLLGYLDCAIEKLIFDKGDPSLLYLHGRLVGSGIYMILGILVILFAKRLVILMSKGLKDNDS
jgi:hypothetical protein